MDNLPEENLERGEDGAEGNHPDDFTPSSSAVIEEKRPYFMRSLGSMFSSSSSSKVHTTADARRQGQSEREKDIAAGEDEEDLNSPYDVASKLLFPDG